MADGQSRVLQCFDDRRVRVGELGVLPHQGDGALLQQPVRPAGGSSGQSEECGGIHIYSKRVKWWREQEHDSPVRHLLPLGQHLPGPGLDGHVEPPAQVAHHALALQQQRHPVDGRHVVHADHLASLGEESRVSLGSILTAVWGEEGEGVTCSGSTWQNMEIFSLTEFSSAVEQRHMI